MRIDDIAASTTGVRAQIATHLARTAADIVDTARAIHADPELSFEEHGAAERLVTLLRQHGLDVTTGTAGLPTAFVAEQGSGSPVVAILCEYDALPDVGHACGHHLIAGAGAAAGLALAPLADQLGITLRVVGTPAEEPAVAAACRSRAPRLRCS